MMSSAEVEALLKPPKYLKFSVVLLVELPRGLEKYFTT